MMRESGVAWIQGELVTLERAMVPVQDRGHLLGDGVFETMRVQNGVLLDRERHSSRLGRGVVHLGLRARVAEEAWRAVDALVQAAVRRVGPELYLRVQVTTGQAEDLGGGDSKYSVTAFARPYKPYPRAAYEAGIKLALAADRKPVGPGAGLKLLSFHAHAHARRAAVAAGADDAVLLNEHGRVCEATTSNLVAVLEGTTYAPGVEEGAVDGVTRAKLLALDPPTRLVPKLELATLRKAREILLTNTLAGVLPVAMFEGRGLAGPKGRLYRRWSKALETGVSPPPAAEKAAAT